MELLGKVGDDKTALFLKQLYDENTEPKRRIEITSAIAKIGEKKLTISLLKGVLNDCDSSLRPEIAGDIYSVLQKANGLIFGDSQGKWQIVEIPDRYTF